LQHPILIEGLASVHKVFPFLMVIVIGLLAACNNGTASNADNANTAENTENADNSEQVPTLGRPQSSGNPDQEQDAEPEYDPGPYFTPRRESPIDPATFVPPEQIGDFTQLQLRGNCLGAQGQQSQYINSENQVVHFSCRFMLRSQDAQDAIRQFTATNGLTGDPILTKIQGDESFVLGPSGNGFTYAWNHGQWLFVARSAEGRPPLDSFMEDLPF